MFGQGFRRMESRPVAPDGEYEVILGKVHEESRQGWDIMVFPFRYASGEDLSPNEFALFQPKIEQGSQAFDDFCKRATKIFDCFYLKENFEPDNIKSWEGKRGTIRIGKDKKGFAVVKSFLPNPAAASRKATANQQDLTPNETPEDIY